MEYLSVEDARGLDGLRLVLTQGVPGPWGESAKALFDLKGVSYHPVAQMGGAANEELVAWTGHRNAPIAVFNDEPPRASWLEILFLAERLGESPRLLPDDIDQRMLVIGLSSEICSPGGFAWQSRMFLLKGMAKAAGDQPENFPMLKDYSYSEQAADQAVANVKPILRRLARQLDEQAAAGSDYLVGSELTAADIYWAFFSQLLVPLPEAICPMPGFLRKSYGMLAAQLGEPAPASLLEHRDRILERHIALPLTF